MEQSNNTLPDEVVEQIKKEASYFSGHNPDEDSTPFRNGYYSGYISGATAWAQWKVKHDELKADYDLLASDFNKLLQQKNAIATALQEFVSKHEAGLLPDRFVYDKAIKILNDGK